MPVCLSQLDPRWSSKKIGRSFLSIGRFGCTITSLSMALSDFGIYMTPSDIADHDDWFTDRGLIIWKEIEEGLQGLYPSKTVSLVRYYGRNDALIREALSPGTGVLLEVANKSHWIKADRKALLRNDYVCRDPWTGEECMAIRDYRNIIGFALLKIS